MIRPGSARAPKGAAGGACRPSRRRESARRPEWVRPYRRGKRALGPAASRILATVHAVVDAGRQLHELGDIARRLHRSVAVVEFSNGSGPGAISRPCSSSLFDLRALIHPHSRRKERRRISMSSIAKDDVLVPITVPNNHTEAAQLRPNGSARKTVTSRRNL
jgi:hypothetical protein